jgi:phosphoribosyl 1,2-cyclic phosphodiesterase
MRELSKRLASIGEDLTKIDAILITHEHSDHVSGLPVLARNKNVRAAIYMTHRTAPAIDWGESRTQPRLEPFQAGMSFQIGDIEVQSFSVPHDAIDPIGFCFEAQGVRIGVAVDLGYIPESIKYHLRRMDLLMLEANHDLDMLKVGPYPWVVKQRVLSRTGHLSNHAVSEYLSDPEGFDGRARYLVLAHLSQENNNPDLARLSAEEALNRRPAECAFRGELLVATQDRPLRPLEL